MSLWDQILDWWRRPRPVPRLPPNPPTPTGGDAAGWLQLLWKLHNAEREKAGLRGMLQNAQLESSAMRYAALMASRGQMSHSVDGTSVGGRIAATGYSWQRAGENIAAGQRSPEAVTAAWMGSPGHRQNILGPYPDVGFGYARTGNGALYWCADFASPVGSRLLDRSVVVAGFDAEFVWEPPGLYGPGNWDSTGRERIGL
jgi:uncharacterized protein YkwD